MKQRGLLRQAARIDEDQLDIGCKFIGLKRRGSWCPTRRPIIRVSVENEHPLPGCAEHSIRGDDASHNVAAAEVPTVSRREHAVKSFGYLQLRRGDPLDEPLNLGNQFLPVADDPLLPGCTVLAVSAHLAVEQKQAAEWTDLGVKIVGGVVETDEAVSAKSSAATETETVARLAGATGVFYAVIVLLHACVLLLPAKGFTRELELAHFKKGAAERQAVALRAEEHRTLREIYEHVRIAPEQYRSDLVEATEPVHATINQLYKRRVIGISGVESTPPDSNGTSSAPRPQPLNPNGPNGNGGVYAANGHSHATAAASINGSNGQHPIGEEEPPVADWDAIFPSGHRA